MEPEGSLPHYEAATWPYSEPHKSSPCSLTSWRSILILPSHLSLGIQSGLNLSHFPTKTLYATLLSLTRPTKLASLISLDLVTRMVFGEEYSS
jgi:hypothetical protein